jgi:hypothetical protein
MFTDLRYYLIQEPELLHWTRIKRIIRRIQVFSRKDSVLVYMGGTDGLEGMLGLAQTMIFDSSCSFRKSNVHCRCLYGWEGPIEEHYGISKYMLYFLE